MLKTKEGVLEYEMLTRMGISLMKTLHPLSIGVVHTLFNGGDVSECDNYRG
jgi:hypothetical protein